MSNTTVLTPEQRKASILLKKQIIDKKTGDAQKRARKKDLPLSKICSITNQIISKQKDFSRPVLELRQPTEADIYTPEERIGIGLLTSGYVHSYSEFFKIVHQKSPGSYHYDFFKTSQHESAIQAPPVVPVDKYEFIKTRLVDAEVARRVSRDADLAKAYTDLSQYFQSINDMKIAIIYLEKLRDYALFTSDLVREAQALKEIGRLFKEAGNLESCLHFCEECLSVAVSINDGVAEAQAALIEAYREYSNSLISRGEGVQAINFLQKSLSVATDSGVILSLAICHHELGICFRQLEQLDSAIEHFEKSFSYYKVLQNIEGQSAAVSSLATSYKFLHENTKAVEYFKILHELANKTGNAEDKAMSCLTMGKILWETNQKEEALVWFQKNFDISLELNDLNVIEDSRISLGVSLANYRMSRYETLVKRPEERNSLLGWIIDRDDAAFKK